MLHLKKMGGGAMRTGKTKEVKIIQSKYEELPWDDEAIYDREEYEQIRHDLAEYRASTAGQPIQYRVITRRVPINERS